MLRKSILARGNTIHEDSELGIDDTFQGLIGGIKRMLNKGGV